MINQEVVEKIKNSDGDIIFNSSYSGQMALLIKDGKFIIEDVDGANWSFDKFHKACYFAAALNSKNNVIQKKNYKYINQFLNDKAKECYKEALEYEI